MEARDADNGIRDVMMSMNVVFSRRLQSGGWPETRIARGFRVCRRWLAC